MASSFVEHIVEALSPRPLRAEPPVVERGQLALRLAFALSFVWLLPAAGGPAPAQAPEEAALEAGMGGGAGIPEFDMVAENASLGENDPAIAGVPVPESLSRPRMLIYGAYTIKQGDMLGILAQNFGLDESTLFSVNNISNARTLPINKVLKIPNQDGIIYKVKQGDSLASIAETYKVDTAAILTANQLFSETVNAGTALFIPGARLDQTDIQERNGDLFIWPVRGYITSNYGYRSNPFGGNRQFHSGLDIGAAMGAPIHAAMGGRVSHVGYDPSFGNYVVINHHSGYRTLYAHMSRVRVKAGTYVGVGARIGDVGTSGRSTGPHVHFTVYKNGRTVNPRTLMK